MGADLLYNRLKHFDFVLVLLTVLTCAVGIMLVFSLCINSENANISAGISNSVWLVKVIGAFIGGGIGLFIGIKGFDFLKKYRFFIYGAGVILMLLTFTPLGIGPSNSDDKAWLSVFGRTIQPSELLKLCFILSFSIHLAKVKAKINKPYILLGLLGHAFVPVALCLLQHDQGTAVVFMLIAFIMLIGAGIHRGYILGSIALSPCILFFLWKFVLEQYQKDRILVLFNPSYDPYGTGYQQIQGRKALISGGFFGKGLFADESDTFVNVSESQNDFIFSYAGQAIGYIGCAIIVILLALICIRLILNAKKCTNEKRYICVGVFGLIFVHTVLNLGMVLGVLPVIGVPLPFISAGGTAMVSQLIALGMVHACFKEEKIK